MAKLKQNRKRVFVLKVGKSVLLLTSSSIKLKYLVIIALAIPFLSFVLALKSRSLEFAGPSDDESTYLRQSKLVSEGRPYRLNTIEERLKSGFFEKESGPRIVFKYSWSFPAILALLTGDKLGNKLFWVLTYLWSLYFFYQTSLWVIKTRMKAQIATLLFSSSPLFVLSCVFNLPFAFNLLNLLMCYYYGIKTIYGRAPGLSLIIFSVMCGFSCYTRPVEFFLSVVPLIFYISRRLIKNNKINFFHWLVTIVVCLIFVAMFLANNIINNGSWWRLPFFMDSLDTYWFGYRRVSSLLIPIFFGLRESMFGLFSGLSYFFVGVYGSSLFLASIQEFMLRNRFGRLIGFSVLITICFHVGFWGLYNYLNVNLFNFYSSLYLIHLVPFVIWAVVGSLPNDLSLSRIQIIAFLCSLILGLGALFQFLENHKWYQNSQLSLAEQFEKFSERKRTVFMNFRAFNNWGMANPFIVSSSLANLDFLNLNSDFWRVVNSRTEQNLSIATVQSTSWSFPLMSKSDDMTSIKDIRPQSVERLEFKIDLTRIEKNKVGAIQVLLFNRAYEFGAEEVLRACDVDPSVKISPVKFEFSRCLMASRIEYKELVHQEGRSDMNTGIRFLFVNSQRTWFEEWNWQFEISDERSLRWISQPFIWHRSSQMTLFRNSLKSKIPKVIASGFPY